MKYDLNKMMCLDVFLSDLTKEVQHTVDSQIQNRKIRSMPLLSWDLYMEGYSHQLAVAIKRLERDKVLGFAQKFNWKNDLNFAFSENDYEALIIMDLNQNIIWVNEGFSTMTGYSKKFAMNKTPKFLQGKETLEDSKSRIRKKILLQVPFKELIINHKKNGMAYTCEVKIIPLISDRTTHFIAFEKEVI
ncbi:PAS domain-containing protein [Gelidibacter sp. F63206]|uniref:PAS domain-containing protein n=1 Tax=Gelidibacter sp. F63206 TaxID=2926425 RepID=UPI001FF32A6B|nr:PAS domain-containing protein [Gelidibacter sp. F63206]MCK0115353.1 PAS domain-containing protein [Gelidibacter sp. F63206]